MKHENVKKLLLTMLAFVCIVAGMHTTANAANEKTIFRADAITARAGSTVTMNVNVENNPGILGMALKVEYDEGLELKLGQSGDAFSKLTMTKPGNYESGCKFAWDGQELSSEDIKDGAILKLSFDIEDTVSVGTNLGVRIICEDPVNENLEIVDAITVNGSITITNDTGEIPTFDSLLAEKTTVDYEVGDELDVSDLTVTALYSDMSSKIISPEDYIVDYSQVDMDTPGTKLLTISYTENGITQSAEIEILVKAVLESIKARPTQTVYKAGDTLDLSGLTVMATYSGNRTQKVTGYQTNASDISMDIAGEKTVIITYTEGNKTLTDEYKIEVKPVLTGIETSKEKTFYNIGDTLSLDDMVVYANYLGKNKTEITDYTTNVTDIDMDNPGNKSLVISYEEDGVSVTNEIVIHVGISLKSITVEKGRTEYFVNEKISLDDVIVKANYSNNTSEEVSDYATNVNEIDVSSAGKKQLIITYKEGIFEVSAELQIQILNYPAYIDARKDKTEYIVGDLVDLDDLTVVAYYTNGSQMTIKGYTTNVESLDMSSPGVKMLIVSVGNNSSTASASIPIIVREKEDPDVGGLIHISRTNPKLLYYYNLYNFDNPVCPPIEVSGLKEGVDYIVTYNNNVNAGKAQATVTGIGAYTGNVTLPFVIEPLIIDYFAELMATKYTYTGKPVIPKMWEPDLVKLVCDITYSNNVNIGTATITFKGKGNFTGTVKYKYDILPGKVVIKKAKGGKKKISLKLKALKGGVKYQIQYKTGKGKWKSKTVRGTKATLKKLKAKKVYKIRVRAFKKVAGKNYYGPWSKTKKVKTKK